MLVDENIKKSKENQKIIVSYRFVSLSTFSSKFRRDHSQEVLIVKSEVVIYIENNNHLVQSHFNDVYVYRWSVCIRVMPEGFVLCSHCLTVFMLTVSIEILKHKNITKAL